MKQLFYFLLKKIFFQNNDLNDTTNKYLNCSKATQESSSNIYAKDCTESVDNQGKKDMVVSEETNSMNDCICLTIPKNNEQEVQVNNTNAEELHKLEKSPCSLEADTMSQSCIDNEVRAYTNCLLMYKNP